MLSTSPVCEREILAVRSDTSTATRPSRIDIPSSVEASGTSPPRTDDSDPVDPSPRPATGQSISKEDYTSIFKRIVLAVKETTRIASAVPTAQNDLQNAAAVSLQSLGYAKSLAAAIAAERRVRLARRR